MGKKRISHTQALRMFKPRLRTQQQITAQIIPFPQNTKKSRLKKSFDADHQAQILFFMGVRYERHECQPPALREEDYAYERCNQSA
jgi:hypothetical protein